MLEFPRIASGSTRDVYDLGDGTVIKVCFWPGSPGIKDYYARSEVTPENASYMAHRMQHGCPCAREAKLWNSSKSKALLPVLAHGACWVRMPFVAPAYFSAVPRIDELFNLGVGDQTETNFALYKGRKVCIDYGG
jgi:hypothetical protein